MAPCARNSSTVVTPPSSPYGLSSVNRSPVKSWSPLIGTPRTMFAHATPHSSAARKLDTTVAHSHAERQRGLSDLPQNSNETPRTISATRIRKSAM